MIKEKINKEDIQKEKKKLKRECFNYLDSFSENRKNGKSGDIKEKFNNICQKTGSYDVPSELFQTRTSRKNRVLISWRAVKANNLDIEKLNSFENGVVVEFLNEDFLDKKNQTNKTFLELKNRLGSDKNVTSIITFRKENGSPSSSIHKMLFLNF